MAGENVGYDSNIRQNVFLGFLIIKFYYQINLVFYCFFFYAFQGEATHNARGKVCCSLALSFLSSVASSILGMRLHDKLTKFVSLCALHSHSMGKKAINPF